MDQHPDVDVLRTRTEPSRHLVYQAMIEAIGKATTPHEVWDAAMPRLAFAFHADAGLGFRRLSHSRLQFASGYRWPGAFDDRPVPIAPDSQAAYVLGSDRPVICADFMAEHRFLPAAPIARMGYSSSMSARLETPQGIIGLVGIYSRKTFAFDDEDADDFAALASMLSIGLYQTTRLNEVEHQASHDELTGLLSRSAVLRRLETTLANDGAAGLMMIDLDGFKSINDRHGHHSGDRVLENIATRLQTGVGLDSYVGRLGGDEFLVVSSSTNLVDLRLRAERLIGACEMLVSLEESEVEVSASVGIAISTSTDTIRSLLQRVDRAMYKAKSSGRGRVSVSVDGAAARPPECSVVHSTDPCELDTAMVDHAIRNVRAVFQRIVDRTGTTIGFEALARGPFGSPLESPVVLFEAATTFGRLPELELAAKRAAFAANIPHHLRLFINLEPAAFAEPVWLGRLADAWSDAGAHPNVTVELTERALIDSPGRLLQAVEQCRSIGWRIAIDDIGARSDSLTALRLLRPDVVKLDMTLIQEKDAKQATRIATAVAAYCDRHGADVVAEGVEHEEQRARGEVLGANLFQGFLFGRPEEATSTLAEPFAATRSPVLVGGPVDRVAAKRHLLAISRHIEAEAGSSDCVLLCSLQHAMFYTQRTRRQYEALARRCGFVGVIGQQLDRTTMNGVRLADVAPDDPFATRWWVVLLSSHASLALVAEETDSGTSNPSDAERLFRYRLITDPSHVETAARELFQRF